MNDKAIVFMGLGFELAAMVVGGSYLGSYIDEHYGLKGTAQTYLVLALLIAWFSHLFYLLRKFERENDDGTGGPQS